MTKVKDIGEQGLLAKLQSFCPAEIIGDDAAVLVTAPGQSLVVTTDVLVDGVHFSDTTTDPEDAGWRAAAANLSDLAAMGASPLGITVGLGLPGDLNVSWVERLYQGMAECLQKYNTPIVGGDVVRSPVTTVSITAFGQVDPQRIIRRCAAQVGMAIVVTGVHGASHAGLQLLLHPQSGQNLSNEDKTALIKAHQRPQPRLDVLPILWEIFTSSLPTPPSGDAPNVANATLTPVPQTLDDSLTLRYRDGNRQDGGWSNHSPLPVTGMDSSDGLADAVLQICRASGVGAVLERHKIPVPASFENWLTPEQAIEYALYGGEDFELVLCLPPAQANTLVQQLSQGAAIIGTITSGSQVLLHDEHKKIPDQVLSLSQGFQHFGQ